MFDSLQPPQVPDAELKKFALSHFGLRGTWHRLEGERDQNFRVTEADGKTWVFKVGNAHEQADIFDAQLRALQHIARVDLGLPVPRVRHSLAGTRIATLTHAGSSHSVMVLSYLTGTIIGDKVLSAEKLRELGNMLARLGRGLRGFVDGAPASRQLAWDHRQLPHLLDHLHVLPLGGQVQAKTVIEDFCRTILPKLETLRSQIIHGDVHPFNTLMDGNEISGIIDFGDMIHGTLIQDLANAIADYIQPGADNASIMFELIRGYCSVTPLEEDEVEMLLPLIETRLLMTPLLLQLRAQGGAAEHGYLTDFSERAFPLLKELQGPNRQKLIATLRRAAAFPSTLPPPKQSMPELLARRHAVLGERLQLFYDTPLHIVSGEGVWLRASDGRRYLDCYNNVPHVGHSHPYVVEAIARQMRKLNTNTRYMTDESILFAERLTKTMDKSLNRVVFVNSGSEANDVAWRMAKAYTSRSGGLAMEFAYHGITDATDAFSPSNALAHWSAPHIRLVPPPDDYRGPFKRGEAGLAERYAGLADQPISDLANSSHGVAAAMIDSAFMTNGMLDAPAGYLQTVVEKVRKVGGLFIADEVQSGFGRMGTAMWGHRHHGVVPDFVTIGKPAGNGHPIGAVITRAEILDHFSAAVPIFSTFGGNNVSCAAGMAVLDVIRDENLINNARITGTYLRDLLRALMTKHSLIGDVRGVGLAIGVELVRDRRTLEPATAETQRVANLVRDEGVLIGTEGLHGNILKIRPPIVLKPEQAELVASAVDRALQRL